MSVDTFTKCSRRFGVEIEYNSFDKESRSRSDNDLPLGIYEIANCISNTIGESVEVNKWHYTNNNSLWEVKPDSSCGIEVCSPPLRGVSGINEIVHVIENLSTYKNVYADQRCSLHVHVDIEDFTHEQVLNLFEKWVNFEIFFILMTKPNRWLNQYCIPIGFSKEFDSEIYYGFDECTRKLSSYKYYAINLFHYVKNKRKTIEFRCMGNESCMDSDEAKNWCKLLLCFVERCKEFLGNKDFAKLQYMSLTDAMNFLNISEYFNDNEILFWIIEKLSDALSDRCFLTNENFSYYWEAIINKNKIEINNIIDLLEAKIR